MSDYGEGDYDEGGQDWIYVEDYYDVANELAEYTCPSPAPANFDTVSDEYDVHDYWQDIEYVSDGGYYEDYRGPAKRKPATEPSRIAKKRKLKPSAEERMSSITVGPVSWMTQLQRYQTQFNAPLITSENTKSTALLKDWYHRFKDSPGLVEFPSSDFHPEETGEVIAGDGFDLGDLQSIAGLLSEENMGALQEILKAKGLDPAAVQEVLQDMLEGRERTFDEDEDENDVNEDEENASAQFENEEESTSSQTAQAMGRGSSGLTENHLPNLSVDHSGRASRGRPQASTVTRGSKRKETVELHSYDDDTDEGRVRRGKWQKISHHENNEDGEKLDSSPNKPPAPASNTKPTVKSQASTSSPGPSEEDVPRTRSGRIRRH